jgi:phosphoglycolate phosphatase-like HAD superfamily hydrolase
MSEIKQIFIDLDGPLLDGKRRHYFCYRTILEKSGFEPIGLNAYWKKKRAKGNRMDLLKMSGAEEMYNDFLATWLALIESPEALALDEVQVGAVDCLSAWQAQGVDLILVTMRKNKPGLEAQLERLGLWPLLNAVLVCDYADGGIGKADAVRKIDSTHDVGRALWIGDTEADWEAAQSLGCGLVLLANGLRNMEYLMSLSGAVVQPSIASLKNWVSERINVN